MIDISEKNYNIKGKYLSIFTKCFGLQSDSVLEQVVYQWWWVPQA